MPITDTVPRGTWYFQLQTESAARKDMVGIRLSVTDQAGADENKEVFYIVRWMIDPALGLDTLPAASTGTGGSTGAGGSSGTGGASGAAAPAGGVQ